MNGFDDSYFEHYCFFDDNVKTPYPDSKVRYAGNRDLHKFVYEIYKNSFNKEPSVYFDLGCGTGEEIAYFLNKGLTVRGCDISDFCFKNQNEKSKPFIKKTDSINFLENINSKADILLDSTLQYVEDCDFDILLSLIKDKTNDKSVIGIIFDSVERNHPYRKQLHSKDWWQSRLIQNGFTPLHNVVDIFTDDCFNVSDYIFYK